MAANGLKTDPRLDQQIQQTHSIWSWRMDSLQGAGCIIAEPRAIAAAAARAASFAAGLTSRTSSHFS